MRVLVRKQAVRLVACLFLLSPIAVVAAQYKLSINKDQNADNVIIFEDNMTAVVQHTSEGMEITLPGIDVALRCKSSSSSSTATDKCVIAVEATTVSSTGSGSTSGGTTSGSTSSGSTSTTSTNSSGDCVVTTWNDCSGSGSGTSSGTTTNTDSGSTTTNTGSDSTSSGNTSTGSGACTNSDSVTCGGLDYGSGGSYATGAITRRTISPGRTLALPFTIKPGAIFGKVGIVPTSSGWSNDGSGVRMFWSTEPGGNSLSSNCAAKLGQEGSMWWDQSNVFGFACQVPNTSGRIYLNLRLCISDNSDGTCTGPNAKYGNQSVDIYISGSTENH